MDPSVRRLLLVPLATSILCGSLGCSQGASRSSACSSNGTRVNGMLIGRETATPLSVGDQIRFGDKTFVVRDAPRESPANR